MKLETVDYLANDAAEQFVSSLRDTGFGVLKNHPIPKELVESIYENWYKFFLSERKNEFHFNVETQDGYFPPSVSEVAKGHSVKDIKEYFHIYPWGQIPEELKEQILEYYQRANNFAEELLGWVEKHAPAEVQERFSIALSDMINGSDKTLLRVLQDRKSVV